MKKMMVNGNDSVLDNFACILRGRRRMEGVIVGVRMRKKKGG